MIAEGQHHRTFPAHRYPSPLLLSYSVHDFADGVQPSDTVSPRIDGPVLSRRFASARKSEYLGRFRPGSTQVFVSDIFREIDEELRRDNLLKLWSRYGRYLVALVVLVLVVAGGLVAWREHQLSERRAQSARYASALALSRDGKGAEAAKVFGAVAQEGGGYAVLALFEEAELLARAGDRSGAVAAYDRIAATGGLDPVFRELAVLLSAMHGLPEADSGSVIGRLAPLTAAGNPWRATALELTAAARLKSGDKSGALDIYKSLADDLAAPQGLRARAAEIAAALAS
jgi:hypothetical protein